MPKPHPFAAAPVSKGWARAVSKPAMTVYGYARVSTGGQSVDAQARQLRAAGAGKVSGKWRAARRLTGRSFAGCSPKSLPATW